MSDQEWDDAPSADLHAVEGLDLNIPGTPKAGSPIPGVPSKPSPVSGAGAHAPSASRISSDDWEWGDADYSDSFDEVGERQIDTIPEEDTFELEGLPAGAGAPGFDPVEAGYQQLANDTEEQQIAAERQKARAARQETPVAFPADSNGGVPGVPGIPLPPVSPVPAPAETVPGIPAVSVPVPHAVPVPVQASPAVSPVQVPVTGQPAETVPGFPSPQVSLPPVQVEGVPVPGVTPPGSSTAAPVTPTPVSPAPEADDWEDAPVAGVALPLDAEVALEDEVPWLGRKTAGTALPQVSFSQAAIVPEYLGEVPAQGDPNDIDFDPDEQPLTSASDLKPLAQDPVKKKKSQKKIRLTERDMELLAFLARYRIANVNLLAQRFGTSVSALRNRLPALHREGLITSAWVTQSKPKVWLITQAGLAVVGMSLTAPTVRWGQLRHTLGLTEMGIKFELAGENVLTEREIRAAATRYTPTKRLRTAIDFAATVQALEETGDPMVERVRTALTVPVPGRGFGHIPDMVLARDPYPNGASGSIAIELELTRKGLSEWKTVLTAYRDSGNFDQVYYLVASSEIKRGLEGVIKALGAQNKIHVMPIVLNDLTSDPESMGGGGE